MNTPDPGNGELEVQGELENREGSRSREPGLSSPGEPANSFDLPFTFQNDPDVSFKLQKSVSFTGSHSTELLSMVEYLS